MGTQTLDTAPAGMPYGPAVLNLINTALGGSVARVKHLALDLADRIEADGHGAEARTIRSWFYDAGR